jgi:hypothetical protein
LIQKFLTKICYAYLIEIFGFRRGITLANTARYTRIKHNNDKNLQEFWESSAYHEFRRGDEVTTKRDMQYIINDFTNCMLDDFDREPRRWTGKETRRAIKKVVADCLEMSYEDAPSHILEIFTHYLDFMAAAKHISNRNTLLDAATDVCADMQTTVAQQASDERIAKAWARVNPLLNANRIDRNSLEALTYLVIAADKLAVIDMATIAARMDGADPNKMTAGDYLDDINDWIERYVFPLYDLSATAQSISEQLGNTDIVADELAKTILIGNLRNDEAPTDDETRFQIALRLNQLSLRSSQSQLAKFATHYRSALAWQPAMKRALPQAELKHTLSMAAARKLRRGKKH